MATRTWRWTAARGRRLLALASAARGPLAATILWAGLVMLVGFLACNGPSSGEGGAPGDAEPSGGRMENDTEGGRAMATMTISSSAFQDGQPMPEKYSQDGANVSPPLAWSGVPDGAAELAMICDDPDAPRPEPWVHWVIYGIPADAGGLSEGVAKGPQASEAGGAAQGINTGGDQGYDGPRPPKGHGMHHYHFKLMALDARLGLQPGLTKEQLLEAVEGHVMATAELIGTYER